MNRCEKQDWVKELRLKLDESSLIVAVRPLGLTVAESTELRRRMKEEGGEFRVIKNTLAQLSVKDTLYGGLSEHFKGPTALAYSKDPIAAARVVAKFAQENNKLSVLGGFMDGRLLSQVDVNNLATLPSLDELRAKMIAIVMAPATKLAILLKEPSARIARVLAARQDG